MGLLLPRYWLLFGDEVRGLAQGLDGLGRVHAGGLQQVHGGRADLADEHAGLQVVAPLEYRRRLPCSPEREVAGIVERVARLLQMRGESLYSEGELQDRLGKLSGH